MKNFITCNEIMDLAYSEQTMQISVAYADNIQKLATGWEWCTIWERTGVDDVRKFHLRHAKNNMVKLYTLLSQTK